MLYFLFDVTVEIKNSFITAHNEYEVLKAYSDGISEELIDADIEKTMNEFMEVGLNEFPPFGDEPEPHATLACYPITEEVFFNRIAGNI
jgi:hypothetical protein